MEWEIEDLLSVSGEGRNYKGKGTGGIGKCNFYVLMSTECLTQIMNH